MKKPLKIGLIIVAVIVIIAALALCIFFAVVKDKTPLTAEEFKTAMEEAGYTVTDETGQYLNYDENITQVYVATSENGEYEIEFYVISDEEYAKEFYSVNKDYFESTKGNKSSKSSISLKNYSKYTLTSDSKYKVLSRVENTVIYITADDTYKDEIKTTLKNLGY